MPCFLCEVDDARTYRHENGYRAVQCRQCGLIYVDPPPDAAVLKALYESQRTGVDLLRHQRARDRKEAQARWTLGFLRRYLTRGRLLEVGSAAGYFLRAAQGAGFEVQGIELAGPLVRFSREVLGVSVQEGTLAEATLADGAFDGVVLRNVLSHLSDPLADFGRLQRLLRPGGVVLLETGNVAELPEAEAGALELPEHVFHYSERNVRRLLARTGLTWLETQRFTLVTQLPAVRWLQRLGAARSTAEGSSPQGSLEAGSQSPSRVLASLPRRRWRRRGAEELGQWLRYGLGRWLSAPGRRCTLVVAARRA